MIFTRFSSIAILSAFVIVAGSLVACFGGDDNAARPAVTASTLTPSVGLDVAPTAIVRPTSVPPTEVPATPPPLVVEAPQPIVRTCPEIRSAGSYLNPEERAFFLANCTTQASGPNALSQPGASAQAPAAPAAQPPPQTGPTEEERAYRNKAQAQLADQFARLNQFWGTASTGVHNDILTLGSIAGNLGLQMGAFEPAPPRFQQAHSRLRAALGDFSLWMMTVTELRTEPQIVSFIAGWQQRARTVSLAWNDYILVVGLSLQRLP